MKVATTLLVLFTRCILGSQNVFSVNDDVFAYPQYQLDFSDVYVLEEDAAARIESSQSKQQAGLSSILKHDESDDNAPIYEQMIIRERRFLCSIPRVETADNVTEKKLSKEVQQKELIQAASRGRQLLQDMEGKQCLYYSTGWWSYAFCYNSYVKQFHSLPPAQGAARVWPPQEDQTTPSYILGRFENKPSNSEGSLPGKKAGTTEVQTRADGNYLVQRLEGGTLCDLTGKSRRVEIEFHCHPQTTDRIGWIKETTTCSYLMVIYTPRLCNDVAFQPPRDSQAHTISCQEILSAMEASQLQDQESDTGSVETPLEKPIMIGNIEVGGMKHVGRDGKKIEKGRIVMTAEEKAEIIMMQKDGQIQGLSRTKMKELNLEPDEVEKFKKELQKLAGSKDWKIERLGNAHGPIELRGIVASDGDGDGDGDDKQQKKQAKKHEEPEEVRKEHKNERKDEL